MAGLYIHIPFCATKCIYCDFYSEVREGLKEAFLKALKGELKERKCYLKGESLQTIYFGGGTPSRITAEDYQEIFSVINSYFQVDQGAEITLEANPDDLTDDYIQALRSLPFNRLSIGIQSLNDEELQFMNRRHRAQAAIDVVCACRKAGFNNISIDLIYGIPGQTDKIWKETLDEILRLDVPHISAYSLTYEQGTRLWQLLKKGTIKEVDEEASLRFFETLMDRLAAAGYDHYEVSNFAKPGCYSRHNTSYWEGVKYLGAGPSAHSYDGESRQWNVRSTTQYIQGVEKGNPYAEKEILTEKEMFNDAIITRLRTRRGIDLEQIKERFGAEIYQYLRDEAEKYLLSEDLKIAENRLFLTRKGLFVSDGIMTDLLYV